VVLRGRCINRGVYGPELEIQDEVLTKISKTQLQASIFPGKFFKSFIFFVSYSQYTYCILLKPI